jgi:hypothetical protein
MYAPVRALRPALHPPRSRRPGWDLSRLLRLSSSASSLPRAYLFSSFIFHLLSFSCAYPTNSRALPRPCTNTSIRVRVLIYLLVCREISTTQRKLGLKSSVKILTFCFFHYERQHDHGFFLPRLAISLPPSPLFIFPLSAFIFELCYPTNSRADPRPSTHTSIRARFLIYLLVATRFPTGQRKFPNCTTSEAHEAAPSTF